MKKLLLVSNDRIGSRMAGPAMRYYHFARELGKRFDVTLVAPEEPDIAVDGAEVIPARRLSFLAFRRLAARSDAVVAQQLSPQTMRALAGGPAKVVYDLYDPLIIETLPFFAGQQNHPRREQAHRDIASMQLLALATGDAFVCASDRQRDLWLGILSALGRVDVPRYEADPSLRTLIDVVPFGIESEDPQATGPALRGVVPGIEESDRVLLWGGGVWNWFDPLTVIRAVDRLARERGDVKLYFLGVRHPNPSITEMTMTERAVALARELGVEEKSVFFNFGWVPYGERQNYLLEADLGVSAHFDNAETRFSFRTRLLDYFWAGLPTVTTAEDELGDLVERRGLGRALPAEDVDGWVSGLAELLGDDATYEAARRNVALERERYRWPRVISVLADLADAPRSNGGPPKEAVRGVHSLWRRGTIPGTALRQLLADAARLLRRPEIP